MGGGKGGSGGKGYTYITMTDSPYFYRRNQHKIVRQFFTNLKKMFLKRQGIYVYL